MNYSSNGDTTFKERSTLGAEFRRNIIFCPAQISFLNKNLLLAGT